MLRLIVILGFTVITFSAHAETYRLVHAIGNAEKVVAKGMSKPACEEKKRELKTTATALGTYNESTGAGSITCLPDSLFK